MKNNELANLLFPNVTLTVEELEKKYPFRDIPRKCNVTRFAPSPTGYMHIGGLYASLISATIAHQSGGVFYLRIEDTDKKRELKGGVSEIISSLNNFGIHFDEGMTGDNSEIGNYGPYMQSMRKDIYQACAKHLVEKGLAYPCFCSAEELDVTRAEQEKNKEDIGYYGKYATCRNLSFEDIKSKVEAGEPFTIRLNADLVKTESAVCDDLVRGKIEFPANKMDIVLLKTDGLPTYHFAHVVDDHFMRTTHVVRGDEWLPSYPVHEQLFAAMGFYLPKYIHIAPIMKFDGSSKRKLSKRKDPEAAVGYYNEVGYPKEAVLEYLFNIANSDFEIWREKNPLAPLSEFKFKMERLPSVGALFDFAKLESVSRNIISKFSASECAERIEKWASEFNQDIFAFIQSDREAFIKSIELWKGSEKRPRKDVAKWADLSSDFAYIYAPQKEIESYQFDEHLTREKAAEFVSAYSPRLDLSLDAQAWFEQMKEIATELGYCANMKEYKENPSAFKGSIADLCALLRIILTGKKDSPDLYSIMCLIGEKVIKERFASFVKR